MRLALFHPAWAYRSCSDCKKWVYQEGGERMERAGKPVLRLPMIPTPCGKCPKIPEGVGKVSSNAVEPSEQSWRAYRHYRECRAVGSFPEDGIVKRNAAIIRAVEDAHDRQPLRVIAALLGGTF